MIARDLVRAAGREYDVLIVGGGVYGAALLLGAARRGLSACLCEARDFGGATSANSLRILHGGLRYLQGMELASFFESVRARRGWARDFPGLLRPLECLMPLYGVGLQRPALLRWALCANDALGVHRNRGVPAQLALGRSALLDPAAVRRAFPAVRARGLRGGALWRDYFMYSSERVLIEMLRWACSLGATALNYAAVEDVLASRGRVAAVQLRDGASGQQFRVGARAVVNCTGPALAELGAGRGGDAAACFRPSLAFNVLLAAPLDAPCALAVSPPGPGAPLLFAIPQGQSTLAGTMHRPRPAGTREAEPSEAELEEFLALLRAALPGFAAQRERVRRVFAGLLPVRRDESTLLVRRSAILDHGQQGGVRGLYSVAGAKFTTARTTAEQLLERIAPGRAPAPESAPPLAAATPLLLDAGRLWIDAEPLLARQLLQTAREESARSLDDLVLRRSNWASGGADLERARECAAQLLKPARAELGWSAD